MRKKFPRNNKTSPKRSLSSPEETLFIFPNPDKPEPKFCHFGRKTIYKWSNIAAAILGIALSLIFTHNETIGFREVIEIIAQILVVLIALFSVDKIKEKLLEKFYRFIYTILIGILFFLITSIPIGAVQKFKSTNIVIQTPAPTTVPENASFLPMEFKYENDIFFINLPYYIDGQAIPAEERPQRITVFVKEQLQKCVPPDRYKPNAYNPLNVGSYADNTALANEYFYSYEAILSYDIPGDYRIEFLKNAHELRQKANTEYVTQLNNQGIIVLSEALCSELKEQTDSQELIKIYNRDIMYAAWNILLITYYEKQEIDAYAKSKLIEAYTRERDTCPEANIIYNDLIKAFSNL